MCMIVWSSAATSRRSLATGRLAREQAEHALMHVQVAAVDAVVALDHHHRQLVVALEHRLDRLVQRGPASSTVESVSCSSSASCS